MAVLMVWENQHTATFPDEVSKNPISKRGEKDSTGKPVYDAFFSMLNFSKFIMYKQIPDGC